MINTLKFVRGSVSTKDLIPVLQCFHLYAGRIQGQNGKIAIDAPFQAFGVGDFTVPAERFLKAVDACDGEPTLNLTDGGKLTLKRKSFRATLPLGDHTTFPLATKSGELIELGGGLLPALRLLRPFVSEDASRPWSTGILLRDGYAYATNNIALVRTPLPWGFGAVNLPVYAVDELLRIGQEPTAILQDNSALVFELGDAWLRAHLLMGEWPSIETKFEGLTFGDPVPPLLTNAIDKILPFCPDPKMPVIKFGENGVSTTEGDHSAAVGDIPLPDGSYRAEVLQLVLGVATHVDFAAYPNPIGFSGNDIEGMFVGLRA
jgi:hypothetical protein